MWPRSALQPGHFRATSITGKQSLFHTVSEINLQRVDAYPSYIPPLVYLNIQRHAHSACFLMNDVCFVSFLI